MGACVRSVLITGVQGVGKSTLGRGSARALGIKSWDFADLMLQVASDVSHKDDLALLSRAERDAIYRRVEVLLAEWFKPGDGNSECVLLENHLTIIEDHRIRTFPHHNYHRYNVAGLVIVESEPISIHQRRLADQQRYRLPGSIDEIARQQACNRSEAASIAAYLSIPSMIIRNQVSVQAVAQLTTWLHGIVT